MFSSPILHLLFKRRLACTCAAAGSSRWTVYRRTERLGTFGINEHVPFTTVCVSRVSEHRAGRRFHHAHVCCGQLGSPLSVSATACTIDFSSINFGRPSRTSGSGLLKQRTEVLEHRHLHPPRSEGPSAKRTIQQSVSVCGTGSSAHPCLCLTSFALRSLQRVQQVLLSSPRHERALCRDSLSLGAGVRWC